MYQINPLYQRHLQLIPARGGSFGDLVVGTRVWPNKYGFLRLPDGGYGQDMRGAWWVRPPGQNTTVINGCSTIVEHFDETLSTVLSGYWRLEKGAWSTW